MNMHTPQDKCLMVFSSYYLPRNQFFLLPASLPASLEKWVKSILLPWKLTGERANTLGQVPDGVCRWLKSHRSSLKAFGPLGQALPPLPATPQKVGKCLRRRLSENDLVSDCAYAAKIRLRARANLTHLTCSKVVFFCSQSF